MLLASFVHKYCTMDKREGEGKYDMLDDCRTSP